MSRRPRHLVLHPFLLAVYPVLHLYSANVGTSRLDEVWEPCGVLLTLACASLSWASWYCDERPAGSWLRPLSWWSPYTASSAAP